MTVWSPLAGGLLTGRYEAGDDTSGRLASFDILPYDREAAGRVIGALREIGGRLGHSPAQVALAWLLAKPAVTSVIVGASKPQQLADNLAAADLVLSAEDVARLDAIDPPTQSYPHWYANQTADAAAKSALGGPKR